MIGESREEEGPEGKAVVGPSGEAIMYSSGNALLCSTTPPFFKSLTIPAMTYSSTIKWISTLHVVSLSHILDQILPIDESDEEEAVKMET